MNFSIQKETLDFFKRLEKNNDRDWFNDHKIEFRKNEKDVKEFFDAILKSLKEYDEVDTLKMYRIYRDVRFSKNKLPYKTHFAASFNRVKPKLRGGYYVHIQPNNESFIATGFWDPSPADLLRIRKEFEMDDTEIRAILNDEAFNSVWGNFVGDEVKSAPRGFNKKHKAINLIKKKQFIFVKKYTDREVLDTHFITDINTSFKAIRPYFNYMSEVLTTDLNGVSLL